jgi:hypothetical protein
MPTEYTIDPEKRRVTTVGRGTLVFSKMMASAEAMKNDPALDPSYTELVDITDVEVVDLTAEQIEALAGIRIFDAASRRAIVAPRPLYFGMARMYEAHHSAKAEANIRVFTDREEAVKWLDGGPYKETRPPMG